MKAGQQIMLVGIQNGILVQTAPLNQLVGPGGQPVQQVPVTQHCSGFEELVDYLKELIVVSDE